MNKQHVRLIAVFAATFLISAPVFAKKYQLAAAHIVPAASGDVETHQDKNGNTDLDIKVRNLARPSSLTPPATTYVVWFQQAGSPPENMGELKVDSKLEGELKTETNKKTFDLLITAENDPAVKAPVGVQVMNATIQE